MTITNKSWTIIEIINWGTDHFTKKGINNAKREMEWFLCEVLDYKRIDLYLRFDNILGVNELEQLRYMVKRRVSGEPFQHIIGKAPFYGRDFIVNSNVLIPRPETEILIDRLKQNGNVSTLLDIGTGCGCIAITCALEKLSERIYATDISLKALDVARKNMQIHYNENIQFACHDFLKKGFKTKFDVIVSNPPYISVDEMDTLQDEVRDYDPKLALMAGSDGLIFYRRFSEMFTKLLNPYGYLLLEIGGNSSKKDVENIFLQSGHKTTFFKDIQGDYRVIEVRS